MSRGPAGFGFRISVSRNWDVVEMDLIESYGEELRLIRRPWTRVWVGGLLLVLILLPWYAPDHVTYIATIIFIYAVGVQGQNLLIGYTGQISFGQAGFLAIGAFTFGHLSRIGIPWPLCLMAQASSRGSSGFWWDFPLFDLRGPTWPLRPWGLGSPSIRSSSIRSFCPAAAWVWLSQRFRRYGGSPP